MAAELGYETDAVQKITTAGLLPNLGKLKIDQRILRTPRKFTHEEFEIIKSHPTLGFEQLAFREDLFKGK
ncbi:metal-dependent phosphohydrolase, partial [Rubripirellula sp.]|nr:metal-dependent phosphohydrolase [Rubripirellula sp.]